MEIVRFKKDGGPLKMKITINGLVGWRYTYWNKDQDLTNDHNGPGDNKYVLINKGEGSKRYNRWTIHIFNISKDDQNCDCEIE